VKGARLLALAFLLAHSAFAINALAYEDDGVGAGVWCDNVTALMSGHENDPTQITVSALSSEHSGRFNEGTHQ
jgi:hypothetical protein